MTNILLVDTNLSSSPLYKYLVECGYKVFVVGSKPDDFLAKTSEIYINFDYSDIDLTRQFIKKNNIKHIIPGCNDLSYKVCAELNSEGDFSGLDSPEINDIINKKNKFRLFAEEIGLPVPRVISYDSVSEFESPLIVKPVDAYSGRGMTVLNKKDMNLLEDAVVLAKKFSQTDTCLIEEYVEGQLYSHSAFISNMEIILDFIVEEFCTANPFVVDTSRVVYDFPAELLDRVRRDITLMIKKLNLVDGLIHTQFIKNGSSYWIIEVTRRCPGDLYSQLIELSTGYPYAEIYMKPFINKKISIDKNLSTQSWVMRHTISSTCEGFLGSIKFNYPVYLEKMFSLSLSGDMIKPSPFSRIGLGFFKTDSEVELNKLLEITLERKLYKLMEAN